MVEQGPLKAFWHHIANVAREPHEPVNSGFISFICSGRCLPPPIRVGFDGLTAEEPSS